MTAGSMVERRAAGGNRRTGWLRVAALLGAAFAAVAAHAHSASDAYLTVDAAPGAPVVKLQWDIALRDLDFVLRLDDDGNGDITWGELQRHQAEIGRYAASHLTLKGDGRACPLAIAQQRVGNHADGAYAVLNLEARCPAVPKRLALDYRLFFAIDPSHRAIVVAHSGTVTATAQLSPQTARIELNAAGGASTGPARKP